MKSWFSNLALGSYLPYIIIFVFLLLFGNGDLAVYPMSRSPLLYFFFRPARIFSATHRHMSSTTLPQRIIYISASPTFLSKK